MEIPWYSFENRDNQGDTGTIIYYERVSLKVTDEDAEWPDSEIIK